MKPIEEQQTIESVSKPSFIIENHEAGEPGHEHVYLAGEDPYTWHGPRGRPTLRQHDAALGAS